MESVNIYSNKFEGSLHLESLPECIEEFDAGKNNFSGTVNLHNLPRPLCKFGISENRLEGSVCITQVPPKIRKIDVQENFFETDVIVINEFPPTLFRFGIAEKGRFSFVDQNGNPHSNVPSFVQ
uniref:Uncharacterized protein n=1 Tax=Paramoeba aestuarina TaxID=180227 RepID=A0A7S4KUF2_9EUKA|mmetsp:Transcript_25329/g.39522  ORF Transcript_25329/g.39522 Transcript_25329/m.39522 type:complete len:124 (+) Transcript_25329:116-487(+)